MGLSFEFEFRVCDLRFMPGFGFSILGLGFEFEVRVWDYF